jgi:putative ABC transport system permease protein
VNWWQRLVRKHQLERQADEELRGHLERLVSDHMAAGMSEGEARREARLEFGGLEQMKEACRDAGGLGWIDDVTQDVRYSVRTLRATPIVTAVAVLSLALGIGANTAIFSLINSLELRALPVKDPTRLALITDGATGNRFWSYAVWDQVRQRPQLFNGAVAWSFTRFNLASGGETQFVDGLWASGSFFDTLGVLALLGRNFSDADDRRGARPVTVISYSFWQRRFGGAGDAIGRTLALDNVPFTIIGVTPQDFFGADVGRTFDVVVPIGDEPLVRGRETWLDRRIFSWLTIMARLKPGQMLDAATSGLRGAQSQIREATLPENLPQQALHRYLREGFTLLPAAGNSRLRRQYERPLLTVMVVVALVLLIACANIANVLLTRAIARRHELSMRLALGASRWRLVRQLLTESAVLAGTGAAFGLLIASWGSRLLVRQLSTQTNTVFLDLSIDWRVLAFAIGVTVGTALLFGTIPALRASGVAPMNALKAHGRGTAGDARVALASGLVVAQLALSVVLVVAAGLLVRTLVSLETRDLGFQPDRVLLVDVDAQHATEDPVQRIPLYERTREVVRALPGVAEAAVSLTTPLSGLALGNRIEVSAGTPLPEAQRVTSENVVSPGWFRTFGTPIITGRDFTEHDGRDTPPVAIVNQAFARRFLNGASPLGHTVKIVLPPTLGPPAEIVGLAADAVYGSLRDPVPPTMYRPLAQQYEGSPAFTLPNASLSVRSNSGSPLRLIRSVSTAINAVHSGLALTFLPLADQVNASLIPERVVAILSGFFGALALLLAGLGLYGITAYAVSRRRTDIGIRMALGAERATVVRLVLSRVSVLVGLGVTVGAGLSWWASQFVASLLYGVEARDPLMLVGVAGILAAVGAFAGWLPAWRASRIDPAVVLRCE